MGCRGDPGQQNDQSETALPGWLNGTDWELNIIHGNLGTTSMHRTSSQSFIGNTLEPLDLFDSQISILLPFNLSHYSSAGLSLP